MDGTGSKRAFLAGTGASLAALALPRLARGEPAGTGSLRQLLDRELPPELRRLIPADVIQIAEIVDGIPALEAEARRLRLPASPLSVAEALLPRDPERLYELALPRLVALIDRAGARNPRFADSAGAMLAKLHGTQHVAPEALGGIMQVPAPGGLFRFDAGQESQALPLPGASEPDSPAIPAPTVPEQPVIQGEAPVEPAPLPDTPPDTPLAVNRSLRFDDIEAEYAALFAAARLRSEHQASADWHLAMMQRSRARYEAAGKRAGVPWFFIAAVHGLEASFNFRAHFHNGDFPLTQRTRQVPAGRPRVWLPPSDWESSTVDALRMMGFAGQPDWNIARTLFRLEAYNGFGYRRLGKVSPYLWSFSTHYDRGKFVADGRYNARARSQQCGAAVMLKLLADAGEIVLS